MLYEKIEYEKNNKNCTNITDTRKAITMQKHILISFILRFFKVNEATFSSLNFPFTLQMKK